MFSSDYPHWDGAGTTADIPPGSRRIIEVARRAIGVFDVAWRYYALRT